VAEEGRVPRSLCDVFDQLSPETRALVVRAALYQKLREHIQRGEYLSAIELVKKAGEKGYIPSSEAARTAAALEVYYALRSAAKAVESLADLISSSLDRPDILDLLEHDAEETRKELMNALNKATSLGIVCPDCPITPETFNYALDLAGLLEDLAKLAGYYKQLSTPYRNLQRMMETLGKLLSQLSSQLASGDLSSAYDTLDVLSKTIRSLQTPIPEPPDFKNPEIAKAARQVYESLRGLQSIASGFAAVAELGKWVISGLMGLNVVLEKIGRGEASPADPRVKQTITDMVYRMLYYGKQAVETARKVWYLEGSSVHRELYENLLSLASTLEEVASKVAGDLLREAARTNRDIYEAVLEGYRRVGVTPPSVETSFTESLEALLETWAERFRWAGRTLSEMAGKAGSLPGKIALEAASIAAWISHYTASAILAIPQLLRARIQQLRSLLRGDLKRFASIELQILRSLIPRISSWEEAAGLLASIVLLSALASRLPVVRYAFDSLLPELGVALESLRAVTSRLGPRLVEIVDRQLRLRVPITAEGASEVFASLRRLLEERVGRANAEYVLERVRALLETVRRNKVALEDAARSIEEVIREVPRDVTVELREVVSALDEALRARLNRILASLYALKDSVDRVLESSSSTLSSRVARAVDVVDRVASMVRSELEAFHEAVDYLREHMDLLRGLVGSEKAEEIVSRLSAASLKLSDIGRTLESLKAIRDALEVARRDVRLALESLREAAEALGAGDVLLEIRKLQSSEAVTLADVARLARELVDRAAREGARAYARAYSEIVKLVSELKDIAAALSRAGLPADIVSKTVAELEEYLPKAAEEAVLSTRVRLDGREVALGEALRSLEAEVEEAVSKPASLKMLGELLARIKALLKAVREAVEDTRSINAKAYEDLVRARERVERLLVELEGRLKVAQENIVREWGSLRDVLDSIARDLEELGYRDVAASVRSCWELVPDWDSFIRALSDAVERLEREVKPGTLTRVARAVKSLSKMLEVRKLPSRVAEAVKGLVSRLRKAVETAADALKELVEAVYSAVRGLPEAVRDVVEVASNPKLLADALSRVLEAVKSGRLPLEAARKVLSVLESAVRRLRGWREVEEVLARFYPEIRRAVEELERATREKGKLGALEMLVEKYKIKVARITPETASLLVKALSEPEKTFTVKVRGAEYSVTRIFRPDGSGGFEVRYRAEGPEGYWAEMVLRVVARNGRQYVLQYLAVDPRVSRLPPSARARLMSSLAGALRRALGSDVIDGETLVDVLSRVGVETPTGVKLLGEFLSGLVAGLASLEENPEQASFAPELYGELDSLSRLFSFSLAYGVPVPEDVRKLIESLGLSGVGIELPGGVVVFYATKIPSSVAGMVGWYRVTVDGLSVVLPGLEAGGRVVLLVPVVSLPQPLPQLLGVYVESPEEVSAALKAAVTNPEELTRILLRVGAYTATIPEAGFEVKLAEEARAAGAPVIPPPPPPPEGGVRVEKTSAPPVPPGIGPIILAGLAGGLTTGRLVREVLVF